MKFALGKAENIVGKGEKAGYQHFLLFPQCFQKASNLVSLKVGIVWQIVNLVKSKKLCCCEELKNVKIVLGRK